MGFPLTAVFLVSAAALSFEILLMRILSITHWHHFAWMIISLALLGYGASGSAIALARPWLASRFRGAFAVSALLFSLSIVGATVLAQHIPFNALELIWNPRQFLYLGGMYLVFIAPFLFAASCIGLAFSFRRALIERIYLADLLGAGAGAMLIVGLLFLLPPARVLVVLALMPLAASLLPGLRQAPGRWLGVAQVAWLLVLLLTALQGWVRLQPSEFKGLSQALEVVESRVLDEQSGPLGLLTVVESPRVPFRHAPGLSFNARSVPPEQLAVFTDGDSLSVINRHDGSWAGLDFLADLSMALPYRLLDQPDVLVLGSGAGSGVLLALHQGASHVDAVELNPQMAGLVRVRFAEFAGRVLDDPRVTLHIGEARAFAARSSRQYDLVQIGLLDSFGVAGSGVQALNESYLYTVEAIGEYLQRLRPGGVLAITRWLRLPPRDSLKLAATIIAALRESGASEPGAHLAVIRSWNTVTLLVGARPLDEPRIRAVRDFSADRSFDVAWYPSMGRDEANRYNRLAEPYLYDGISALLGPGSRRFTDRYKFNIEPATDDRPYFFHFFKWGVLPEVLALRKRGGASLIEWGYLVLSATLLQAVAAGFLLIIFPLWLSRRHALGGIEGRVGAYFFLLGLAFLFIEMAFIQKFILFLGHPLYSVAVVLAGFLLFAGLGSGYTRSWANRSDSNGISRIRRSIAAVIALSLIYALSLPLLLDWFMGAVEIVRIGLTLLLIAPLAFFMGMPFPLGLKRVAATDPAFIPWAWGLNGFASVISAILATILAIHVGFTAVLLMALGLYAAAALCIRQRSAVT